MLVEIGCIVAGVPLGYILRKSSWAVQWGNHALSATIYAMLFFIGVNVGGNEELLARLADLGVQGMLIGVLSALGSVLFVYVLYGIIIKKEKKS